MIRRRHGFDRHTDEALRAAGGRSWNRWCACARFCMPLDWNAAIITEDQVKHDLCHCRMLDPDEAEA